MFTGKVCSEMYQKNQNERVDTLLVIDRKGKATELLQGK